MKRILLATVAVLAATVAQAETLYLTPGAATAHRVTEGPFATAISGDAELLDVRAGATNRDLVIVAKRPNGILHSTNVLLLDGQGLVVKNLHVVVSPFNGPSKIVQVFGGGKDDKTTAYLCANECIIASAAKSDADAVTVTHRKDGSTDTWKHYSTPPTPPK